MRRSGYVRGSATPAGGGPNVARGEGVSPEPRERYNAPEQENKRLVSGNASGYSEWRRIAGA
jgi:hypothetical protein